MKNYVFTVYKVTNSVNGKFYIGVHKTRNPYDSYMGSGEGIKLAIKKYGKDKFVKEVLFIFEDACTAYAKEAEIVTHSLVESGNCYNRYIGGFGRGIEVANRLKLNNKNKPADHFLKFKEGFLKWAKERKDNPEYSDEFLLERFAAEGSINSTVKSLGRNSTTLKSRLSKLLKTTYGQIPKIKRQSTKKIILCCCGREKKYSSTHCATCSNLLKVKFSDDDIIKAWEGCDRIVDVATKLGYKNPNNIGKAVYRIKSLKP